MRKSDVLEMCSDIGMTASGHIKKLVAVWKIFKAVKEGKETDFKVEESHEIRMPKDVQDLLVPNPEDDKYKFSNNLVNELFRDCCVLMVHTEFMGYLNDQITIRWEWEEERQATSSKLEGMEHSLHGYWKNVRKFSAAEFVLRNATLGASNLTVDFLQEEINKVVLQLDKFRSMKLNLLSPNIVQPHKANEIDTVKGIIEKMSNVSLILEERK